MSSWYINPARWTAFIQGITAQQATLRLPWPARTCERIFIGSFASAHTTAACVHAWRISSIGGVKQNRMEEELLWHSRQGKVAAEALLPDSHLFYGSISEMGSCWSHLLAVHWARCWQPWLLGTAWVLLSTFRTACKTTGSTARLLWHLMVLTCFAGSFWVKTGSRALMFHC